MGTSGHQEDLLDEALEETFPASDSPRAFQAWPAPPPSRASDTRVWKKLLVATDLSERSREMLMKSIAIARAVDASIDLVHVREPFEDLLSEGSPRQAREQAAALEAIDRWLADTAQQIIDAGVTCQTTSLEGSPAHQIVSHALHTGADVIVLGSPGQGGIIQSLLGNIASRVTRTATCAVLLLPVPGA